MRLAISDAEEHPTDCYEDQYMANALKCREGFTQNCGVLHFLLRGELCEEKSPRKLSNTMAD